MEDGIKEDELSLTEIKGAAACCRGRRWCGCHYLLDLEMCLLNRSSRMLLVVVMERMLLDAAVRRCPLGVSSSLLAVVADEDDGGIRIRPSSPV
ncbi:hypothetical protein ACLOJK_034906 [Asimina triloba]